jgi:hypothetical protein
MVMSERDARGPEEHDKRGFILGVLVDPGSRHSLRCGGNW